MDPIEKNTSKKQLANETMSYYYYQKITKVQPQSAYYAYIHAFKSKYNFYDFTIPTMQNHMKNIEDVLRNHFIPVIISESSISENLRQLIVLPIRLGGMAVITPHLNTETEYNASRLLTKDIVDHVITKTQNINPTKKESLKLKTTSKREQLKLKIPT